MMIVQLMNAVRQNGCAGREPPTGLNCLIFFVKSAKCQALSPVSLVARSEVDFDA